VIRGGTRPIAVLLAVALAALLLGACGSGSSPTDSGGSTATEASAQANGAQEQGGSREQQGGANGDGPQGQESAPGKGPKKFTAAEVSTPLKVSGGGSKQFIVKGGDNSIQEFGEESGESELQEAAEAVHGFFVARAEGDWTAACSYLSKSMTEQLEQLAQSSTQLKDKGCASFLEAFTSRLPASTWKEITTVDAGSLRLEGEQAFLIYYGAPGKTVYAMPLAQEDGKFKVGALSGNALS
jgi:hypothetical protein